MESLSYDELVEENRRLHLIADERFDRGPYQLARIRIANMKEGDILSFKREEDWSKNWRATLIWPFYRHDRHKNLVRVSTWGDGDNLCVALKHQGNGR